MEKFLIIDGNSLGMRAAMSALNINPPLITKDGIPTGTIVCFFNMLNKVMMYVQPTHIIICWDTDTNTFRKKLYPDYKATRHKKETPGLDINIVYKQFRFIRLLTEKLGIKNVNAENYEADDLCGACTKISKAHENYIVTSDKDSFQLIDNHTFIIFPKSGFTDFNIIDFKYVEEKFNISPYNFIGFKCLFGDISDNIPGLNGCGVKTAAKMLNEFGSSDKIAKLKKEELLHYNKKIKNNLEEWQQKYKLIKLLVTIKKDISLPYKYEDLKIELLKWNNIKQILEDLEMYNFINRIAWGAVYRLRW